MERKAHWEAVYSTNPPNKFSWYQPEPARSLELLREIGANPQSTVIDVGGGDSTLVDSLIALGIRHVTVLDLSGAALSRAKLRLGARADEVTWIEADVTRVKLPSRTYDAWHDRAVFHFLTDPKDRERYVGTAADAIRRGGSLVVATFAREGPAKCSGLNVNRYDPGGLAHEFGAGFALVRGFVDVHKTPDGKEQPFTYVILRRV